MSSRTIFVLGAGASREANLPTSYELKEKISRLIDISIESDSNKSGDALIKQALRNIAQQKDCIGDIRPYLYECWHIRDALPLAISIDNFIDCQRGNEKIAICGKLAIIRSILEAEKNSILYINKFSKNHGMQYSALENTWYGHFFKLLTENCIKKDLKERFNSITMIIFNYDRCFEQFLYHALQNYYRVSESEAVSLVNSLRIYHPYGSVGELPWSGIGSSIEFGADPNVYQLLELKNKIKTFTEGINPDSSDIADIKEHIYQANKIVFLGFAFHKLNMQLITPENISRKKADLPICYASTFGISKSDQEIITESIGDLYKAKIIVNMADLTCSNFFTEYWKSLAF